MLISSSSSSSSSAMSHEDLASQLSVKASFVNLISFQHRARWCLSKSRDCMGISQHSHGTILCSVCKRDCYVAYINCSCYLHPVCLRHEFKPLELACGTTFTLSVRDEVLEMEKVSRMLEEDKHIVNEAELQFKYASDKLLLSKLYQITEDESYIPYCKIDFVPQPPRENLHADNNTKSACHYSDSSDSDSEIYRFKRRSSLKPKQRPMNFASSKSEHQGLKRLKKAEPERLNVISIKYKKTGDEESSVSVGKRRDEKRVLESCPKRIKSVLGFIWGEQNAASNWAGFALLFSYC
ncbi:unnamed protein product [Lactuca saligna]|uniref:Zinc finger C5HC2-type domain-containing protein n=1 Tax=Lactuca saligna TaxID=75948 RepID=A0AA36DX59_LACSI|nr:unnamed protein product [Lactuca saligna]